MAIIEVKDLVNAFGVMTTELQENLNEASRQKLGQFIDF